MDIREHTDGHRDVKYSFQGHYNYAYNFLSVIPYIGRGGGSKVEIAQRKHQRLTQTKSTNKTDGHQRPHK